MYLKVYGDCDDFSSRLESFSFCSCLGFVGGVVWVKGVLETDRCFCLLWAVCPVCAAKKWKTPADARFQAAFQPGFSYSASLRALCDSCGAYLTFTNSYWRMPRPIFSAWAKQVLYSVLGLVLSKWS